MQKCPRCELLLLDTDTECPRCHATVTQLMTPDQAAEQRRKEMAVYVSERARVLAAEGDYIPPWAPVGVLIVTPLIFAVSTLASEMFKNTGEASMWLLIFLMWGVMIIGAALSGAIIYGGVFIFERRPPGIDRSLLCAGLLFGFASVPVILLQLIAALFPIVATPMIMAKAVPISMALMALITTRAMFELETIQAVLLTAACTGYFYGLLMIIASLLNNVAAEIPGFVWPFVQ